MKPSIIAQVLLIFIVLLSTISGCKPNPEPGQFGGEKTPCEEAIENAREDCESYLALWVTECYYLQYQDKCMCITTVHLACPTIENDVIPLCGGCPGQAEARARAGKRNRERETIGDIIEKWRGGKVGPF